MGLKNLTPKNLLDPSVIWKAGTESGGRAFVDPHGGLDPGMRKYTDPAGIIWGKGDQMNYVGPDAGMTVLEAEKKKRNEQIRGESEQATAAWRKEMGFAKGGSVRGSGCAVRGVKKCKMR